MRSPGLVVMGVAGLLVVGYAFYVLLAPPEPRGGAGRSRGDAARSADAGDDEADEASRKPRPRPGKRDETKPKPIIDTDRPKAPPPPRPEPAVPLAEARRQFAEYMAELDRLAAREAELTSPEWVELYKRGHEVLAPLQQNLDTQIPEQAQEMRMANEDMRAKLNRIDPNRPDPPPH